MVSKLSYTNTDAALENASNFANKILRPVRESSTPTIHHEHYHWGSPGWGYFPQPIYYGGPGGSSSSGNKDYSWVAIPATVIAFVTMYCIGQNHAEWSQAKMGMAKLQNSHRVIRSELSNAHPALKSTVQSVFERQMSILDQIRERAATDLFLKGVLVTSVIAAGIGGLATGGWFIPALEALLGYGALSAFITSCAMLYRAGFNSTDIAIQAEAEELRTSTNRASRVLDEIVHA